MKKTVQIVGSGTMGAGIAACAATNGHPTVLIDTSREKAERGVEKARADIAQLANAGLITAETARTAGPLLEAGADEDTWMDDTFLIIEAVFENMVEKQKVFSRLDARAPRNVILASNTSGMRISDIALYTKYPERTATTHFWFPGHLIPLVEVVMGEKTDEQTALTLRDLLRSWGKAPVIVKKDLPGQLANRILQAIIRESLHIVESGLASPEDVDTAIKMGMALRFPAWGPLEHIDAVGLDLAYSVQRDVLPGLNNSEIPSAMLKNLVDTGRLGNKSGSGIYDWNAKSMERLSGERDRFIIGALQLLMRNRENA